MRSGGGPTSRTKSRPIPAGRVQPGEALAFGATLAVFSVAALGVLVNWFAAALLGFTIFFYVFVYTMWLKRVTPQNIVIGGAAGAFPPMIGWASVTGDVSLAPVLMFLIIFLWTPPHFWALSLLKSEDYARAGVPMLPVVAGHDETRRQILIYTLILAPVGLTPPEVAALLTRGDGLLANGDIASARLCYERAAEGGNAQAALRLGESYDPAFLAQTQLNGVRGDKKAAARWYQRAIELGANEADTLLKSLGKP